MRRLKAVDSGFMCAAVALGVGPAAAQAVTFTSATLTALIVGGNSHANVTTLPYATPTTVSDANGSSTVTPDFTGLVFKTSFDQTLLADANASGESTVNFTGGLGDTYSLFGSTAPVGGNSTFTVSLLDNTTGDYLYSADGTLPVVGSSVGGLTAGDSYTFDLFDEVDTGVLQDVEPLASVAVASNSGSGGITIVPGVVPEPETAGVCFLAAAAFHTFFRRRSTTA